MSCLMEIVKWFDATLSFVGIISLIIVVIRAFWVIFAANTEWASRVSISEVKNEKMAESTNDGDCIFPQEYTTECSEYVTRLMFRPQDSIVKKMILSQITYTDESFDKQKLKEIAIFQNITPQRPLIIGIEMAEIIPRHVLSWKGDYGIVAKYYFCMNGRDGNYQAAGMTYSVSFWAKIRKILGLK